MVANRESSSFRSPVQTHLVSGLWRLRRALWSGPCVDEFGPTSRECGRLLGYWLLQPLPLLHARLRVSQRTRKGPGRSDGPESCPSGPYRHCDHGRRRCPQHRWQPFHSRAPSKCRCDVYPHGQPGLWHDQGADISHFSPRLRDQIDTLRTSRRHRSTPVWLALVLGATYVAQGASHDPKQLTELIRCGIEHPGTGGNQRVIAMRHFSTVSARRRSTGSDRLMSGNGIHTTIPPTRLAAILLVEDNPGVFPLGVLFCDGRGSPSFDAQLAALANSDPVDDQALAAVARTFR